MIIIIYAIIFGASTLVIAIQEKNREPILPCEVLIDEENINNWLSSDELITVDYHYNCSTLYVEGRVGDEITRSEMIALAVNLSVSKPIDNQVEVLLYNGTLSCFATLEKNGMITFINN